MARGPGPVSVEATGGHGLKDTGQSRGTQGGPELQPRRPKEGDACTTSGGHRPGLGPTRLGAAATQDPYCPSGCCFCPHGPWTAIRPATSPAPALGPDATMLSGDQGGVQGHLRPCGPCSPRPPSVLRATPQAALVLSEAV